MQTIQWGQSLLLVQAEEEAFWTQILPLNCCSPETQTKLSHQHLFLQQSLPGEKQNPANECKTSQNYIIFLNLLSYAKIRDQLKHYQELHAIFLHFPRFTT